MSAIARWCFRRRFAVLAAVTLLQVLLGVFRQACDLLAEGLGPGFNGPLPWFNLAVVGLSFVPLLIGTSSASRSTAGSSPALRLMAGRRPAEGIATHTCRASCGIRKD